METRKVNFHRIDFAQDEEESEEEEVEFDDVPPLLPRQDPYDMDDDSNDEGSYITLRRSIDESALVPFQTIPNHSSSFSGKQPWQEHASNIVALSRPLHTQETRQ